MDLRSMGGSCPLQMTAVPLLQPIADRSAGSCSACVQRRSLDHSSFIAQGYISNFMTTPIMLLVPVVGVICDVIPVVSNTCSSNCSW